MGARSFRRLFAGFLLTLCAGTAVACGGGAPGRGPEPAVSPAPPPEPMTRHLLLVSVDGLRPDAITEEGTPTLHRMATEGSHSLEAATVVPSTTLPAHVSMLTGMEPEAHGVTWNIDLVALEGYAPFPTLFSVAAGEGLSTAAFLGKTKLRYLADPGLVDHVGVPETDLGAELAAETIDKALSFLRANRPNLLFIHLGDPDYAGHRFGWMSGRYAATVRAVDAEIGRLLEAADGIFGTGSYTVVITSDHGGHSHGHGSTAGLDVNIPWIMWGRGVAEGVELGTEVSTVDTAPTVLRFLGLQPAPAMSGGAVEAAMASRRERP